MMVLSHWTWEQMQMHQLEQVRLQHSGSKQSIPTLASLMVTQRKCSWRWVLCAITVQCCSA